MSINGDYDLFWRLTPRTLQFFFRAEEIKEKRQHNIDDLNNFQLGHYIQMAQASILDKNAKYPSKPKFQVDLEKEGEKRLTQKQIEAERLKVQMFFSNLGQYVKIKKN